MRIVQQSAELLWMTGCAEQVIERAARTCYKSEDAITAHSSNELIKRLIANGHDAMLEHASASFLFVTDRGVTHELVRHRLASYAQESTRYCNYSKGKFEGEITVVRPCQFNTDIADSNWVSACEEAERAYLRLIELGYSPQIARSVLPTCTKADIVCTANLREWRHIMKLRTAKTAHPQMRELMAMALSTLKKKCPAVFMDMEPIECNE